MADLEPFRTERLSYATALVNSAGATAKVKVTKYAPRNGLVFACPEHDVYDGLKPTGAWLLILHPQHRDAIAHG